MSAVEENICTLEWIVEERVAIRDGCVCVLGVDGIADGCVRLICLRQLSEWRMLGASEAPGPPSLHWQCHVVSPHMLVCREGRGRGGPGGGMGVR